MTFHTFTLTKKNQMQINQHKSMQRKVYKRVVFKSVSFQNQSHFIINFTFKQQKTNLEFSFVLHILFPHSAIKSINT